MNTLRLLIVTCFILSPEIIWAQNAIESMPTLDPSSTFIKPTFFNKISSYLVLLSVGALVIGSGVWFSIYSRRHQHPYLFLDEAEMAAIHAEDDGDIGKAIEILTKALKTIENDPKRFPQNGKSRNETIWFLKRKLQELDELLLEDNE